jgi:hypothetical protein
MRRESHRRQRGPHRRGQAGGWGHRGVYIAAVVATAAVIAGFGGAVLIYAPIGYPHHLLSSSTLGAAPVGVSFGPDGEMIATNLTLTNATANNPAWNWTNASGAFTGPCNASGILDPVNGTYLPYDTNGTAVNVTSGNTTLVCLDSVGPTFYSPYGGGVEATWYYNHTGGLLVNNSYNFTNFMANGSNYTDGAASVTSCNSWQAPAGSPAWQSPWNLTHIDNASFTPCQTYYEMNNNTTWISSFDGQSLGLFASGIYIGLPDYANSTLWAPDEIGYGPSDVVYAVPVTFNNTTSTNGVYEISIAIAGVTPVAQTFFFDNHARGGTNGPGTVLIVFDMTAAWLYDASYNMSGQPTPTATPEIYGAIGVVSTVVTQCSGSEVCPVQSGQV